MAIKYPSSDSLGLYGDAAKAYLILQRHGALTLDELASHSNISRHKIYSIAKQLERSKLLNISQPIICRLSNDENSLRKMMRRDERRSGVGHGLTSWLRPRR